MKFPLSFSVSYLCSTLLIGCTTSSVVSIPEIPTSSPANPQGPSGSGMVAAPNLREDAITRATSTLLEREGPAPLKMSTPMDHGNMKMDHEKMNMAPEKMDHSPGSPAAPDSYTCTMDPKIHQSAPGDCPICSMKLVKEKKSTHAH